MAELLFRLGRWSAQHAWRVVVGWIVILAAAAGAMLWVVSHEMIPASHKPGRIGAGTAGLAAGFAVMTSLASIF